MENYVIIVQIKGYSSIIYIISYILLWGTYAMCKPLQDIVEYLY